MMTFEELEHRAKTCAADQYTLFLKGRTCICGRRGGKLSLWIPPISFNIGFWLFCSLCLENDGISIKDNTRCIRELNEQEYFTLKILEIRI